MKSPLPPLPWSGGCRCGAVRFAVSAAPIMTAVCHCRGCQTMTSSAFAPTVLIPAGGFALTQGETVPGGLKGATRHHHCASCLTWVFTEPEGITEFVNLRATLLDDASWFSPFIATCVSEKVPWAEAPAERRYDGFPPMEDYEALLTGYAAANG